MLELLASEAQVYDLSLIFTSTNGSLPAHLLWLLLLRLRAELMRLAWVLTVMLLMSVMAVMWVHQGHTWVTLTTAISKVGLLLRRRGWLSTLIPTTMIRRLSSVLLPASSFLACWTTLIALFCIIHGFLVGARHEVIRVARKDWLVDRLGWELGAGRSRIGPTTPRRCVIVRRLHLHWCLLLLLPDVASALVWRRQFVLV